MEHAEALEIEAADRYVLGLLSAAEADAFEEHYFDCALCADEVRLGTRILDGGRRLAGEDSATREAPVVPIDSRPRRRATRGWLIAAAAALLLAISVNVVLFTRMQNAPARIAGGIVAAEVYLLPGGTRGVEERPRLVLAEGASGQVAIDVPPGHPQYEVSLLRGETRIATYSVDAKLAQDTLKITVANPAPGTYSLVITGKAADGRDAEVARSAFDVVRPR